MTTVIIDYETGNVQSLKYALRRLGVEPVLSRDPEVIQKADKVFLPGVGAAAPAMDALKKYNLADLVPELKQPVFGVCLGMQLMCQFSEEANTECLGIFDIPVVRFEEKLKVPHMGWNTITDLGGDLYKDIDEGSFTYFVHSYYVPSGEYSIATSDYILPFSASIKRDNFYACQFHPEKSGATGSRILKNFLEL